MGVDYRLFQSSLMPYAGVFHFRNDTGNERLRTMEPPRHDDWLPDLPEKGENRKAAKEFTDFIRECVRALAPVSTEKTITIPDLSQYLPDDGDTPDDGFDGPPADGTGRHESFDRGPAVRPISGRNMGQKPPTRPGGGSPGDGDAGVGDEDGDTGGASNDGDGGTRGSKGGGDAGAAGGDAGRTPVAVRSRAFLCDPVEGVYALTVHPTTPRPKGEVFLSVAAVGDDAVSIPVALRAARSVANRRLELPQPGRVGPVAFPRTGPLRVEVTLAEPRRLALDVTAYEEGPADETE